MRSGRRLRRRSARRSGCATPQLATAAGRTQHEDEIERKLAQETRRYPASELVGAVAAPRRRAAAVATSADVTQDPQLLARGYWSHVPHREMGAVLVNKPPFFTVGEDRAAVGPPPLLGRAHHRGRNHAARPRRGRMPAPDRREGVLLSTIEIHTAAGVAQVTLNRPDKRNAIDDEMRAELTAAFAAFDADPAVRVVILTGAGTAFCAGVDLQAIDDPARSQPSAHRRAARPLLQADHRGDQRCRGRRRARNRARLRHPHCRRPRRASRCRRCASAACREAAARSGCRRWSGRRSPRGCC